MGVMRIVFMGSPAFALPSLKALIESAHEVVAVYAQPDRQAGRGRRLQPPPVKVLAEQHGLPVRQPPGFRSDEAVAELRSFQPDVIVVAAFGQILPRSVLAIPARGIVNVHASLLPRWRGAAPVAHAILAGDTETGITIMEIVPALDAGPIVSQTSVAIDDTDTTGSLSERLAVAGARLLLGTLPGWYSGTITPQAQDEALVTFAPSLKKEDGIIDWREPAVRIWRAVRAYNPWPVARTVLETGEPLSILTARVADLPVEAPPGAVLLPAGDPSAKGFLIATGAGALEPLTVQRAGKRPVIAAEFLRGQRGLTGSVLGAHDVPTP
jgi:methionyl-tRNA formyltransferase